MSAENVDISIVWHQCSFLILLSCLERYDSGMLGTACRKGNLSRILIKEEINCLFHVPLI